jgi:hypothetical protein
VVVVVLVPIALGVPAVFVLVPPAVIFVPAALANRVERMTLVVSLRAVASISLDAFVENMLAVNDAVSAAIVVLGMKARPGGEKQSGHESCGRKNGFQGDRTFHRSIHAMHLFRLVRESITPLPDCLQG